jgi:CheY-like chemotaxis protein
MPLIFVADDEPLIAMVIADWLTDLQCKILGPVSTSREALALIERTCPDAAILDVRLADGTSYGVAERLRMRGIPFAFASGQDAGEIDPRFRDAPLLSKPFDLLAIRKALATMVPGHRPPP